MILCAFDIPSPIRLRFALVHSQSHPDYRIPLPLFAPAAAYSWIALPSLTICPACNGPQLLTNRYIVSHLLSCLSPPTLPLSDPLCIRRLDRVEGAGPDS